MEEGRKEGRKGGREGGRTNDKSVEAKKQMFEMGYTCSTLDIWMWAARGVPHRRDRTAPRSEEN